MGPLCGLRLGENASLTLNNNKIQLKKVIKPKRDQGENKIQCLSLENVGETLILNGLHLSKMRCVLYAAGRGIWNWMLIRWIEDFLFYFAPFPSWNRISCSMVLEQGKFWILELEDLGDDDIAGALPQSVVLVRCRHLQDLLVRQGTARSQQETSLKDSCLPEKLSEIISLVSSRLDSTFRYISLEIVPIVISLRLETAGKNYLSLPIMALIDIESSISSNAPNTAKLRLKIA